MPSVIQKHKEMVLRLCKPGEDILKSLTPALCQLVHVGPCPGGEAAELYDSIVAGTNDYPNILLELGDYEFYAVWLRDFFQVGRCQTVTLSKDPTKMAIELMRLSGHLWDVIKRIVIYQAPMDTADKKFGGKTPRQVAWNLIEKMDAEFNGLLVHYDIKLEAVLEANYDKLAGADKGRFKDGYSDAQAQDRRDEKRE